MFINHGGIRKSKKIGSDKKLAFDVAKNLDAKLTLKDFEMEGFNKKVPTLFSLTQKANLPMLAEPNKPHSRTIFMTESMIDKTYEDLRSRTADLLADITALTRRINNPELEQITDDLSTTINEPFLFVVIGEIKAGKSSFINALLREDICPVDPAPCTDKIQQIVYSAERFDKEINPHQKKIGMPVEILKQISIVDTPGTNTLIAHHHEITERFIPSSGLVLFIFPAKNPHTASAWELLMYVSAEWRKQIVFILQQADLATEKELRVNTEKVREYAMERGVDNPRIFQTSAKWEAEGDSRGGFEAIRTFIRDTVTGGRHLTLKLRSLLNTADQVLGRIYNALNVMQDQLEADKEAAGKIETILAAGREQIDEAIRILIDRILGHYDREASRVKSEVEDSLSFIPLLKKSFSAMFSRKQSLKNWFEDLQHQFNGRLKAGLGDIAKEGSNHFYFSLRNITREVTDALNKVTAPPASQEGDLAPFHEKREEMLEEIREKVAAMPIEEIFAGAITMKPGEMSSTLMQGSAVTLIGVAILLTTHVTFVDITGGILTGIGVLISAGVVTIKRGKVLRELNAGLGAGRKQLEDRLTKLLSERSNLVQDEIRNCLTPFLEDIALRENQVEELSSEGREIHERAERLSNDLERVSGTSSS